MTLLYLASFINTQEMCAAVHFSGGWCPASAEQHKPLIVGDSLLISRHWECHWLGALLAGSSFLGKVRVSK